MGFFTSGKYLITSRRFLLHRGLLKDSERLYFSSQLPCISAAVVATAITFLMVTSFRCYVTSSNFFCGGKKCCESQTFWVWEYQTIFKLSNLLELGVIYVRKCYILLGFFLNEITPRNEPPLSLHFSCEWHIIFHDISLVMKYLPAWHEMIYKNHIKIKYSFCTKYPCLWNNLFCMNWSSVWITLLWNQWTRP